MSEYVTPEYAQQLRELAEQLVTPQRFSGVGELAIRGYSDGQDVVLDVAPADRPIPIERHPQFFRQAVDD